MELKQMSSSKWLTTATGGIRFTPDRRAVRSELRAHLEDKMADFQRIFPDMGAEEAEDRAVAEMGDPEEVRAELARVHRPWLGYLWRASQWALGLLAAAALVMSLKPLSHDQDPLWGSWGTDYGGPAQSERAKLGGYTFRITGAAFADYPEDSFYQDGIRLTLRVSSPRFWERIDPAAIAGGMTAVKPDGSRWPMDRRDLAMSPDQQVSYLLTGMEQSGGGPFYREFTVYLDTPDWREGDRVTLEFNFDRGSFTLTAEEIERVVMK